MKSNQLIFVCTNNKSKGKHHCSESKGVELINRFKKLLRKKGLHKKVKVQGSGCLHECKNGPALCVYPKGIFYGRVEEKDVKKIVKKHIVKGKKVKKLAL